MDEFQGTISQVKFLDIKNQYASSLLAPFQQLKHLDKEPVLLVEYPYGCHIVKEGVLQLPDKNNKITSIRNGEFAPSIKNMLSYCSIPLALVLENTAEVFLEDTRKLISLRLFESGEHFGLFELFDTEEKNIPAIATNIFSGARNLLMLPKISNRKGYQKLTDYYHDDFFIPNNYSEHYKVFSQLANLNGGIKQWHTKILFFPKVFVDKILHDKSLAELKHTLLAQAWKESYHLRAQPAYNIEWSHFLDAINKRNMKPRPALISVAKMLLEIATGELPGFRPTGLTSDTAPIQLMQEKICGVYGLESYIPTIMQPYHFNHTKPVYYSIADSQNSHDKYGPSRLTDLKELSKMFSTFKKYYAEKNEFVSNIFKKINIDFFHDEETRNEVFLSHDLPESDIAFKETFADNNGRIFCDKNAFVRGCIRISTKLSS